MAIPLPPVHLLWVTTNELTAAHQPLHKKIDQLVPILHTFDSVKSTVSTHPRQDIVAVEQDSVSLSKSEVNIKDIISVHIPLDK